MPYIPNCISLGFIAVDLCQCKAYLNNRYLSIFLTDNAISIMQSSRLPSAATRISLSFAQLVQGIKQSSSSIAR